MEGREGFDILAKQGNKVQSESIWIQINSP